MRDGSSNCRAQFVRSNSPQHCDRRLCTRQVAQQTLLPCTSGDQNKTRLQPFFATGTRDTNEYKKKIPFAEVTRTRRRRRYDARTARQHYSIVTPPTKLPITNIGHNHKPKNTLLPWRGKLPRAQPLLASSGSWAVGSVRTRFSTHYRNHSCRLLLAMHRSLLYLTTLTLAERRHDLLV